ncbi:MAG: DUF5050 domain-containing protein [Defluviitaleaceae bacterium]|nr:DUF5050 domain-containing protein [Defluviitaleaceae bacterium]
MKLRKMKIIAFVFALFLVLFLTACGRINETIRDTLRERLNNALIGETAGNINNGGYFAQQGDLIYYVGARDSMIYEIRADGSGKRELGDLFI